MSIPRPLLQLRKLVSLLGTSGQLHSPALLSCSCKEDLETHNLGKAWILLPPSQGICHLYVSDIYLRGEKSHISGFVTDKATFCISFCELVSIVILLVGVVGILKYTLKLL